MYKRQADAAQLSMRISLHNIEFGAAKLLCSSDPEKKYPDIEYVSIPEIDWVIQSDNGQIISKTNVLDLSGNVIIENKYEESPSIITTNYLEINPNTMTIATNRDVFITINNNTIQTKGFNAQLRENKLNFSSNMASNVSTP